MSLFRCKVIIQQEDDITNKVTFKREDICFFLSDVCRIQSEGDNTNVLFEDGSEAAIEIPFDIFYPIFEAFNTPDPNDTGTIYTSLFSKS